MDKPIKYNKDGSIDKRSSNGGHKNGGRKTKAEEMGLKDVLMDKMPFDELIQLIADQARKGNYSAQKDLLDRYVGKEPKPIISTIEAVTSRGNITDIFAPFDDGEEDKTE